MSCDPAGTKDGLNLFSYVNNNPLRLTDKTGNNEDDEEGGFWSDIWTGVRTIFVGIGTAVAGVLTAAVAVAAAPETALAIVVVAFIALLAVMAIAAGIAGVGTGFAEIAVTALGGTEANVSEIDTHVQTVLHTTGGPGGTIGALITTLSSGDPEQGAAIGALMDAFAHLVVGGSSLPRPSHYQGATVPFRYSYQATGEVSIVGGTSTLTLNSSFHSHFQTALNILREGDSALTIPQWWAAYGLPAFEMAMAGYHGTVSAIHLSHHGEGHSEGHHEESE